MLERSPCLSGCAMLTTDRETDRQVGGVGVAVAVRGVEGVVYTLPLGLQQPLHYP